tara:strand:+ start:257 stop:391 length:135 start_codon:yes stop_codon:yes gene_type:complete
MVHQSHTLEAVVEETIHQKEVHTLEVQEAVAAAYQIHLNKEPMA